MMMHCVSMLFIVATVALATLHAFSDCDVIGHPLSKAIIALSVIAAITMSSKQWTFEPENGPTFIPTTVLRKSIPAGALHTLQIDAPDAATAVVYWAVRPGVLEEDPQKAFGKFENSGLVDVVGGKAMLRLHCPGNLVRWGVAAPRTVFYRYVYEDGSLSETKSAPIKC